MQVAAIAESMIGREPFALVQVQNATAFMCCLFSLLACPACIRHHLVHASAGAPRHWENVKHHWHHLCTVGQGSAQRVHRRSGGMVGC